MAWWIIFCLAFWATWLIPRICAKFIPGMMVVSRLSLAFSETLHTTKHVAHVCLFITVVVLFEMGAGGLWGDPPTSASYPPLVTLLLQILRLLPLLALPQVVVPSSYRPKSGALFKARALQYCLEEDVNLLADTDWIVHLDEETLVTDSAIRGILNFVIEGRHQFGQGLITYANENIKNWFTTLADSFRVSDDMGKLRFQFKVFHKPLFGWKGSYVVTQAGAERRVTFDHGPDGSVAEDNYFGMVALREGYTFDFIEGEMWEKSPFSIYDFLQQRKRWLQGILLVVHSQHIPVSTKWLLAISLYSWVTMPLALASVILSTIFPVPVPGLLNVMAAFVGGVNFYMYIFGVIKSFRVDRIGWMRMALCMAGALITMPFNFLVENVAVVRGLVGNKHKFYIVNKLTGAPDKVVSTV
ncbi:beta-1,4-mannosyltransferase egh-like isoform X3 [Macrobrachium nipponense]|uniref:beta-1,4-mannosyltransferase egh-like isoform X3 n=1 Tax=Macrobrachium nipponense TaxID=159736 RepID=UPI0030C7EF8E